MERRRTLAADRLRRKLPSIRPSDVAAPGARRELDRLTAPTAG